MSELAYIGVPEHFWGQHQDDIKDDISNWFKEMEILGWEFVFWPMRNGQPDNSVLFRRIKDE